MNTIKFWAEDDRPREKLLLKGQHVLSNAELLAIVIGSGNRNESAVDLAKKMLSDSNNDFNELSKKNAVQLMSYSGIGEAKAVSIAAVLEIGNRKNTSKIEKRSSIKSSNDAFKSLRYHYYNLPHEEFYVLYLNRANVVLSIEQISKGGLSGTVADGKIIFSKALELKASAMILSHNHPSGQLKPSEADLKLTKQLLQFGKLIDVQILDHLIITNDNYFSFADEGIMSN